MQGDEEDGGPAVERLLRTLDHAAPRVTAASVMERARARRLRPWRLRVAASLLLAAGLAGAAWAAPGSPLPRWIAETRQALTGRVASGVALPDDAPPADEAGIAVAPGSELVIQFPAGGSASIAIVRLVDGGEVLVRAPAGAATFTSDARRLLVDGVPPGTTLHIGIPRRAPRVELRVGGRRVLLKDGASMVTATDSTALGEYLLRLEPPSR